MAEQPGKQENSEGVGLAMVIAAFAFGVLGGAVAVLLSTPESGAVLRERIRRGAAVAKGELEGVLSEAKGAWETLRADARQGVDRTKARATAAVDATKEALKEEKPGRPATK